MERMAAARPADQSAASLKAKLPRCTMSKSRRHVRMMGTKEQQKAGDLDPLRGRGTAPGAGSARRLRRFEQRDVEVEASVGGEREILRHALRGRLLKGTDRVHLDLRRPHSLDPG